VPVRALDQVFGATERRDHAGEALGRGAGSQSPVDSRDGVRPVGGDPPEHSSSLARAVVTARSRASRRFPVRKSITSRISRALPTFVAEDLPHVGQQRDGSEDRRHRDGDEALGERAGVVERRHERARPDLHVHDQRVEAGRELLERIDAVISGIESAVAVTSRIAYKRRSRSEHLSCATIAHPRSAPRSGSARGRARSRSRDAIELVERAAVWPRPRPEIIGTKPPHAALWEPGSG